MLRPWFACHRDAERARMAETVYIIDPNADRRARFAAALAGEPLCVRSYDSACQFLDASLRDSLGMRDRERGVARCGDASVDRRDSTARPAPRRDRGRRSVGSRRGSRLHACRRGRLPRATGVGSAAAGSGSAGGRGRLLKPRPTPGRLRLRVMGRRCDASDSLLSTIDCKCCRCMTLRSFPRPRSSLFRGIQR